MMMRKTTFVTLTGRTLDVGTLNTAEREALATVLEKYRTEPEWTRFAAGWVKVLAEHGIEHQSVLFRVCDDLEARLGIAQGKASPPDYRYYLVALIEEQYGSRYKFCKETGLSEAQLSRVLSGKADFSMESLAKVLRALGASLVVRKEEDLREHASPKEAGRLLQGATR